MGQVLHRGLLQALEPVEVAGLWVRRLVSTMKLAEVGWFAERDRMGFGEEVLGGWI